VPLPYPTTVQLSNTGTACPKYYDENARCADRVFFFRCIVDPSAPSTTGLIKLLGSSTFSLPADERALAEMEDSGNAGDGIRQGRRDTERFNHFMSLLVLNAKDRGTSPRSLMQVVRRQMRAVGRRM
jgi:hypothetical protein